MAQIELVEVSKTYRSHVSVRALTGVILAMEMGEFAAAVGPSGSGKTTLLNLIGAIDTPDSGAIRIAGLEVTSTPAAELADFRLRHLGFVFQSFNLFPVLSVLENLEFVPALRGMPKPERINRAERLLEDAGMIHLRDKRPDELSGGEQQRVAVLRAILPEPDLVLADEPTANLDSENAAVLLSMMERLNQERAVTFLFSTHDPAVMSRARRLIRLKDGRIVEDQVVR